MASTARLWAALAASKASASLASGVSLVPMPASPYRVDIAPRGRPESGGPTPVREYIRSAAKLLFDVGTTATLARGAMGRGHPSADRGEPIDAVGHADEPAIDDDEEAGDRDAAEADFP